MAENWGMRAGLGCTEIHRRSERLDFVTVTSHEKLESFEDTERVWRNAWGKLYNAIKRQKPDLMYMIVPEKHKSGRMHVHALWNAEVSQRWLKDNARRRGLGYECKVIPISDRGYAQKYVTKYIGKSLDCPFPAHFRRVRVSNNWPVIPAPVTELGELRWEYIGSNGVLQIVYEECEAKGIALIDAVTGEYFDDIDLGTIIAPA